MATATKSAPKTKSPSQASNGKPAGKGKPVTKKVATKTEEKAPPKPGQYGSEGNTGHDRTRDLPWCDKKVAVIKALKALKATSDMNARHTATVADKAGVTHRDVRHYCYHAKAGGLVGIAQVEEGRGYGFYLTAKGNACDPVKAYKQQEDAKEAAKAKPVKANAKAK